MDRGSWTGVGVFVATVLAVGTLVSLSAKAQSAAPKLSRDWKRVSGQHLTVLGNTSEKDLRRVLKEVNAFRATLEAFLPGVDLSSPDPTTLVVFKDRPSFLPFVPRDGRGRRLENVGGYFTNTPEGNLLVLPLEFPRAESLQTIFHEYTHFVVSRNYRGVPSWLNEGLAEFYSTFELTPEGRGLIGRAPKYPLMALRTAPRIPPIRQLLSGESGQRLFKDPDATALFYSQSWLFVHYMTLAEEGARRDQISTFLDLLKKNKPAADAAREAFGADVDTLDRQMERYARQFSYPAVLVSGSDSSTDDVDATAAPMSEADVAALKARLLVGAGADREAEKFANEALSLQPGHVDARVALGRVELLKENDVAAAEALAAIAKEHPDHFAAQFFLAAALSEARRDTEAVEALTRATKLRPRSHHAWFQLSLALMATGNRTGSDAAMDRTQELYSMPTWHYTRAREAVIRHRDEDALRAAFTFVGLTGAGDESAPYAAFLAVIASRRLGRPDGVALLEEIMPALPPKAWVSTVAQYMTGQLTDDKFLDRAKDTGQRTEAHTYIGLAAVAAGRTDAAKVHFTWVKEKGDRHYAEYRLAREELRRLETSK